MVAVDDLSLTIEPGLLYTLLGPSGCGKTTTLRCVAGLERPDSGEIEVGGRALFSSHRGIAVSAQRARAGHGLPVLRAVATHDAYDTVAFPLIVGPRARRPARAAVRERVERALAVVRLEGLEERPPPPTSPAGSSSAWPLREHS